MPKFVPIFVLACILFLILATCQLVGQIVEGTLFTNDRKMIIRELPDPQPPTTTVSPASAGATY